MGEGAKGDGTRGAQRNPSPHLSESAEPHAAPSASGTPPSAGVDRAVDRAEAPRLRSVGWWLVQLGIIASAVYYFWPVMRCLDGCFVDLHALRDDPGVEVEVSDLRLNAWILGWVQRALLDPAISLFDSNTFHPAHGALTGSEHMIGVALQVLPLRGYTTDAVALHQGALMLSSLVLAWTSFALVRWATGSAWAAGVAAVASFFAPWRLTELSHLQLLSVQWMPLIWLLVMRIGLGDGGVRAVLLLALVLSIQLLSSYYLAFFTTLSLGVLLGVLCLLLLARRAVFADLVRVGAALAIPYVLLVWLSLPYLARDASELTARYAFPASSSIASSWSALAPAFRVTLGVPLMDVSYGIPALVFVLAVTALSVWAEPSPDRRPAERRDRSLPRSAAEEEDARLLRVRTLALALWGIALAAFVMSLGRRLMVGGEWWSLPGSWLAAAPGFANLRAPHRWLILVGVAAPLLAGLGAWTFEKWLRGAAGRPRRGAVAVAVGRAVVLIVLLTTLPWRPLPVRAAIEARHRVDPAYKALALLPPGPIVEIPWPMTVVGDIVLASRYTLASTLHWRPTLNGFTAYRPPSYELLQRVAQQLPHPRAVSQLRSLAGLRYIVVHVSRLSPAAARAWSGLGTGPLQLVYLDPNTRIYEVAASQAAGSLSEALVSSEARALTLTGLSREPLGEQSTGSFELTLPDRIRIFANDRSAIPVPVSIENRSRRTWPGLDVQREGLVELRYRFALAESPDRVIQRGTAPLDVDLPAGLRTATVAHLRPPARAGDYWLEAELVQRLGDRLVPLSLEARRVAVRVVP